MTLGFYTEYWIAESSLALLLVLVPALLIMKNIFQVLVPGIGSSRGYCIPITKLDDLLIDISAQL